MKEVIELNSERIKKNKKIEKVILNGIGEFRHDGINEFKLGSFYMKGEKVEQDTERAIQLIQEAVSKGLAEAKTLLGIYYLEGHYVEQNCKLGIDLIEEAVEENCPCAMYALSRVYRYGYGVKEIDLEKSLYSLVEAHLLEDVFATYTLGEYYFKGIGVEKNLLIAMDYFEEAFDEGYRGDFKILLQCLQESIDVVLDFEKNIKNGVESNFNDIRDIKSKVCEFVEFTRYYEKNRKNKKR